MSEAQKKKKYVLIVVLPLTQIEDELNRYAEDGYELDGIIQAHDDNYSGLIMKLKASMYILNDAKPTTTFEIIDL